MTRQRLLLFLSAIVSVALWTYACGDGTTEPPRYFPEPTTVTVSPATATVVEADTLRLTATATNAYGQVVSGVEFVWASGNTAVAVVDTSGLVTGVGAGEVQVTATAAGVTGRAELTVAAPVPTTIAVTPDSVVLIALGQTTRLTAEVRDQAGRAMEGVPVAWSSADTTVAVVDSSGLVGAVSNGAATVTATAGDAAGEARVTVMQSADRPALVALYNATDGPNWVDNTNWLTDAPLGEWYGVSTDAVGRVVRLDLGGRWDSEAREYVLHGLRGELPAELANLTQLTSLSLWHNDLSGPIPPEPMHTTLNDNIATGYTDTNRASITQNMQEWAGIHWTKSDVRGLADCRGRVLIRALEGGGATGDLPPPRPISRPRSCHAEGVPITASGPAAGEA